MSGRRRFPCVSCLAYTRIFLYSYKRALRAEPVNGAGKRVQINISRTALTAGSSCRGKKVRLLVELDQIKYELNSYDEPLVEMRDSL